MNNGNNTVQISYPTGFTTGSVSVSVVFNCGPSANRTLSVSTIPQDVTIVGPSCVIPGQLNIFTINGGVGATNFTWSITGNASITITSGQGTSNITISFGMNFTTGTLSVVPSSNCGSALTTQMSIGVQAATVANIIGPSTLCVGDVVQYTVDNLTGISYLIWDFPTGINITNSNTANIVEIYVTSSFAGGDMSVQRVNYCGSSPMKYKALSLCPNSSSQAPNQEIENVNELTIGETVITNSDNYDTWNEEEKINFILYPNPGNGIIQFRIYRGDKDIYNVTIKNTTGQVVYQSELKSSDKMVLDNLESGFYYVTTTDDESNTITKILVIN